jgi:hypothetical protein
MINAIELKRVDIQKIKHRMSFEEAQRLATEWNSRLYVIRRVTGGQIYFLTCRHTFYIGETIRLYTNGINTSYGTIHDVRLLGTRRRDCFKDGVASKT